MSDDADAFLREVARVSDRTPPEVALSRIGEQIGRFRLTGELGRGGMGVVYAARDTTLGREVALKVLTAQHHDDDEQRKRLLREARAAAAIEHPNVARMFEVDEQDGELFIVMERLDGPSLRTRLGEQALAAEQALAIIRTIARALGAAHRVGVVHRDLKPDNVMFDAHGELKLLDFGLAKRLPQGAAGERDDTVLTKVGSLLGTPSYMSPEQAGGQPVSARSDVFSLGVMAYELLTGARPFDRPTRVATVNALSHHQPPPIDTRELSLSDDYARLVARMLEKRPEDRLADGDAVVAAMDACARKRPAERLADGDALVAATDARADRPADGDAVMASKDVRTRTRPTLLRWSAAAALLLTGAGVLVWLTRRPSPPTSTTPGATAAETHAHDAPGETSVVGDPTPRAPTGTSAQLGADTTTGSAPTASLAGSAPLAENHPLAAATSDHLHATRKASPTPSPHSPPAVFPHPTATQPSAAAQPRAATSPAPSKPPVAPSLKPTTPVDDDDFGF